MSKKRVKMLLNLGWMDEKQYNLPPAKADEVIEVDERQENILCNILKCALPEGKFGATAKLPGVAVEVESPVADENAQEAIAEIANMRSKEKLQHIIDHDTRPRVQQAARTRLGSL